MYTTCFHSDGVCLVNWEAIEGKGRRSIRLRRPTKYCTNSWVNHPILSSKSLVHSIKFQQALGLYLPIGVRLTKGLLSHENRGTEGVVRIVASIVEILALDLQGGEDVVQASSICLVLPCLIDILGVHLSNHVLDFRQMHAQL